MFCTYFDVEMVTSVESSVLLLSCQFYPVFSLFQLGQIPGRLPKRTFADCWRQVFTGQLPFLSPNQSCSEGIIVIYVVSWLQLHCVFSHVQSRALKARRYASDHCAKWGSTEVCFQWQIRLSDLTCSVSCYSYSHSYLQSSPFFYVLSSSPSASCSVAYLGGWGPCARVPPLARPPWFL